MDMTKNKSKGFLTVGAVFLFSFMRIIALTGYTQLGFRLDGIEAKTEISSVLFWFSAFFYSCALAFLVNRFAKKLGRSAMPLYALVLLDPMLISVQRSNAFLLVSAAFMLFVLADTYEKTFPLRDVAFALFAVSSAIILPISKFSFIPVATVLYFLPLLEGKNKTKSYIMVICAAISVSAGVLLGKLSSDRLGTSDEWSVFKTFESPVQSSPFIYYALAVPSLVILGYLFNIFYKKCRQKKKAGSYGNLDMIFNLVTMVIIFSFGASFFAGRAAICAVGVITPLVFLLMLNSSNEPARQTMDEVNALINKHFFAIVVSAGTIYYISMCILLKFYFQDCLAEYFIVNR